MNKLTIIGDCHGRYDDYVKICKEAEKRGNKTIQLGDMGFLYEHFEKNELSENNHVFIPGNHDNYDLIGECKNSLGDFGVCTINGLKFFFIRGAYSIDKFYRTPGFDYWTQEELNGKQMAEAIELYERTKPQYVFSHTAPDSIKPKLVARPFNSRTEFALEIMLKAWQPARWIFGHFHKDMTFKVGKTEFTCLNELSYIDI